MAKVIISCAITGGIHTPSMSPYLPITPEQIKNNWKAVTDFSKSTHPTNINESMARLVHAAVEAGLVRTDADPEDVLQAMSGFCMFNEHAGWQEQAHRLVNLLVDGLRFGVANSTNP